MMRKNKLVLWFSEIDKNDISLVGGKGANLGEMTSFLKEYVPNGFAITSTAYFDFIQENKLDKTIAEVLKTTNVYNQSELTDASKKIKEAINKAPIPNTIVKAVIASYHRLGSYFGLSEALVAVRSSATAEDLPDASFAGQQETFLNVKGEANVVNKIRSSWASLFTPRAIFYRQEKKFDHFKVGLSAVVQKMVQSDISGVMFTIDPVTNQKDKIVIEAIWGLGEYIVLGVVTPDHYEIEKESLKITEATCIKQRFMLKKVDGKTIKTLVPENFQGLQKLDSNQIVKLAQIGEKIHQHYFFPQDIEWAIEKGKIYIVQTRPVTTTKSKLESKSSKLKGGDEYKELILTGDSASPGIGSGKVVIIRRPSEINKVKKGNVLVTTMTSPDFVPAMKRAAAIITDKGGQTSHAAIVSRELGIPCIVGTKIGTKILQNDENVIVDGIEGKIWLGKTKKMTVKRPKISSKHKKIQTATKLYVNLAEPELAKDIAKRDVDGIGLLRAEFMIAEIGIHPQKLIQQKRGQFFTDKLTNGLLKFCRAFNPRPVIYRATDFKTNEYRHLQGGELFEPEEPNPMLGFRGAIRYINTPQTFALELEAIKKIRNKYGYKNLWLMIPFVRTPKELLEVKRLIAASGLTRNSSFKLLMMAEIPSNFLCLEDFIKVGIDGVSIGSNDLTMLILGLDRDNSEVASGFDERNKAVLKALKRIVKTCSKNKITCSICGQAPSKYPDLVEKLVGWGITSISINPDAIERTREIIAWAEKQVISKK